MAMRPYGHVQVESRRSSIIDRGEGASTFTEGITPDRGGIWADVISVIAKKDRLHRQARVQRRRAARGRRGGEEVPVRVGPPNPLRKKY